MSFSISNPVRKKIIQSVNYGVKDLFSVVSCAEDGLKWQKHFAINLGMDVVKKTRYKKCQILSKFQENLDKSRQKKQMENHTLKHQSLQGKFQLKCKISIQRSTFQVSKITQNPKLENLKPASIL